MSKPASNANKVAVDALWLLECSQNHTEWLGALMVSIQRDIEHGKGIHVKALTGLGQYLAEDWANQIDCESSDLKGRLDSVEGKQ